MSDWLLIFDQVHDPHRPVAQWSAGSAGGWYKSNPKNYVYLLTIQLFERVGREKFYDSISNTYTIHRHKRLVIICTWVRHLYLPLLDLAK